MKNQILVDKSAWQFVLDAVGIETDLKPEEIGAIRKGKVYGKGLIDIINLIEDEEQDEMEL